MTEAAVAEYRPCAVVPTFNNPRTIEAVVGGCRAHLPCVIVVDDGSAEAGRRAVAELADGDRVCVLHRPSNGGKGAAVKDGLRLAARMGYTHALQIDADGQHDLADVPHFIQASRARPEALLLGAPRFDASAPWGRRLARLLTVGWVHVETCGRVIQDPMCGFRVYPLQATLSVLPASNFMDFDPEVAVRLVWAGVPTINLPTRVRYMRPEDGGVSNFRMVRDNARISWMHTRLVCLAILRSLRRSSVRRLVSG